LNPKKAVIPFWVFGAKGGSGVSARRRAPAPYDGQRHLIAPSRGSQAHERIETRAGGCEVLAGTERIPNRKARTAHRPQPFPGRTEAKP